MTTAQDVYSNAIGALAPSEQLRLARLILDGLAEPAARALEYSDAWSDEDLRDLAAFSLNHAAQLNGEE